MNEEQKRLLWMTRHPPMPAMLKRLQGYEITQYATRRTAQSMFETIDWECKYAQVPPSAVMVVLPPVERDELAKKVLTVYPQMIFGYAHVNGQKPYVWDGTFRYAVLWTSGEIRWHYWNPRKGHENNNRRRNRSDRPAALEGSTGTESFR